MSHVHRTGGGAFVAVLAALGAVAAVVIFLERSAAPPRKAESWPPLVHSSAPRDPRRAAQGDTYSNIYRYDYVGPETCRSCHADIYERWRGHPHSRMNKNANAETVVGDFSGRELAYGDGHAVFEKRAGELTMSMFRRGELVRRYRVTRTVGSRFVQMYIGVQMEGPEPPDDPVYTQEGKLPFAFWIERGQWFPQTYDETPEAAEYRSDGSLTPFYAYYDKRQGGTWKRTCIVCHNTYPYARRFGEVGQRQVLGFPERDISLATVPPEIRDGEGQPVLEPWELVTLGISCESCHFGAREHALKDQRISFLPRGEGLTLAKASADLAENARNSPYVIRSICSQCHCAKTQGPMYPHGGASWNSREALDMAAGSCQSAIRCTDCHDPHRAGPRPSGEGDDPLHLEACARCHEELADPTAATAHARHPLDQVSCLDCHMPRIVHGIGSMVRSHRISSPDDASMIEGGWPNACNMCHLDRSVKWTLERLAEGWQSSPTFPDGWKPSEEAAGPRWLSHGEAMVRQVAADAYARHAPSAEALARILPILDDPSPPNRLFGMLAVERAAGRRLTPEEYTPWADRATRKRQISALEATLKPRAPSAKDPPAARD